MRAKRSFLFGGIMSLFCIVGDCLLGWKPEGGESFLFGYGSTTMAGVSIWHYILALPSGIAMSFAFVLIAENIRDFVHALYKAAGKEPGKMASLFTACMYQLPLILITVHTEFCIFTLSAKSFLSAGLSAEKIEEGLAVPILTTFIPFYIWGMAVGIAITLSLIFFIRNGILPVKKCAVLCTPIISKAFMMIILWLIFLLSGGREPGFLSMTFDSVSYALLCFMLAKAAGAFGTAETVERIPEDE